MVGLSLVWVENTPCRNRTIVGRFFFRKSRIVTLYNIFNWWYFFFFPLFPPFFFNNRSFCSRGLLLPLSIPFGHGQRSFDLEQIVLVPKLWPQRIIGRHNRRKLYDLPRIRHNIRTLCLDQSTR